MTAILVVMVYCVRDLNVNSDNSDYDGSAIEVTEPN